MADEERIEEEVKEDEGAEEELKDDIKEDIDFKVKAEELARELAEHVAEHERTLKELATTRSELDELKRVLRGDEAKKQEDKKRDYDKMIEEII